MHAIETCRCGLAVLSYSGWLKQRYITTNGCHICWLSSFQLTCEMILRGDASEFHGWTGVGGNRVCQASCLDLPDQTIWASLISKKQAHRPQRAQASTLRSWEFIYISVCRDNPNAITCSLAQCAGSTQLLHSSVMSARILNIKCRPVFHMKSSHGNCCLVQDLLRQTKMSRCLWSRATLARCVSKSNAALVVMEMPHMVYDMG